MGIFNSTLTSGAGSSGSGALGSFKLKAGAAVAAEACVLIGMNGKGYQARTTDYAVVTNLTPGTEPVSTATGRIVAETSTGANANNTAGGIGWLFNRHAVLQGQGADGSIYVVTTASSNQQLVLRKFSPTGDVIKAISLHALAEQCTGQSMAFLSNGNIVVTWLKNSSGGVAFMVVTPDLVQVASNTAVGTAADSGLGFSYGWQLSRVVALDGGGFAFTYLAQPDQKLAIFTNAGVLVSNASVKTWTGVTNPVYAQIEKLSNGNLVIAAKSNYTTSAGFYYGIWTPAGAQVLAMTQLEATGQLFAPEIAVMNGYFCIARQDAGTVIRATVFNNAGAVQGAAFSGATGISAGHYIKLLSDGAQFLLLWQNSTGSLMQFTKIPVTGAAGAITTNITTSVSPYNGPLDAFVENGIVVVVTQNAAINKPCFFSVYVDTGVLTSVYGTVFGVTPTTCGNSQHVIPGGDFSFICLYDTASPSALNLFVSKYGNTSIAGASGAATPEGGYIYISSAAGVYSIAEMKGSSSKSFDHTSGSNIYGNKGAVLTNGLVLKGM
jgi:hypothetical protein